MSTMSFYYAPLGLFIWPVYERRALPWAGEGAPLELYCFPYETNGGWFSQIALKKKV